jgi:hypothetical protein
MVGPREEGHTGRVAVGRETGRQAVTGHRGGGEVARAVGEKDVALGARVDGAEAVVGRVGVGHGKAAVEGSNAEESLAAAAAAGGFAGAVPVEGEAEGGGAGGVAKHPCAVRAQRGLGLGQVQAAVEGREVAHASQRARGATHALPVRPRGAGAVEYGRAVVVAVGIDLRESDAGQEGDQEEGCGAHHGGLRRAGRTEVLYGVRIRGRW